MDDMFKALFQDVVDTAGLVAGNKNSTNKRHFVRAVMSYVEGMTYQIKQAALCFANLEIGSLTDGERAILKEVQFSLNKNGAYERPLHPKVDDNIRFAFYCYAKVLNTPFEFDESAAEWVALQKTIQLRHRLMHPKSPTDLEVSNGETDDAATAAYWFAASSKQLSVMSLARLEQETSALRSIKKEIS